MIRLWSSFLLLIAQVGADVLIYPAPTPTPTLFSNGEKSDRYCGGQARKDLSGNAVYPNGRLIQSSGFYYHPNGQVFKQGDQAFYPNGRAIKMGDNSFFMSGQNVKIGSTLFYANGAQVNIGSDCYFLNRQMMDHCPTEYEFSSDFSTSKDQAKYLGQIRKPYFRVSGKVTYPNGDLRPRLKIEYVDELSKTLYEVDFEKGLITQISSEC